MTRSEPVTQDDGKDCEQTEQDESIISIHYMKVPEEDEGLC